jgi:hypothetical protein
MSDDNTDEFLAELLVMWEEGNQESVVMALSGHPQSVVARFARDLDDYDRGRGREDPRHVDLFIRLLESRGR